MKLHLEYRFMIAIIFCLALLTNSSFSNANEQDSYCQQLTQKQLMQVQAPDATLWVYLWSPGMPLSLLQMEDLQKIELSLGTPVVPLRDFYFPIVDTEKEFLQSLGMGCFYFSEQLLVNQNLVNHFPAWLYIKNGVPQNKFIQGYEQVDSLILMLKDIQKSSQNEERRYAQ